MNIEIDITRECNFKCIGCNRLCNLKDTNKKSIMTINDIISIIKECNNYDIDTLYISGGEPTLNPDFFNICMYISLKCKAKNIKIITNNSNSKQIDKIKKICKNIQIDIQGDINNVKKSKIEKHLNFLRSPFNDNRFEFIKDECYVNKYAGYGIVKYNDRIYYSICCCSVTLAILLKNTQLLCNNLKECLDKLNLFKNNLCIHCAHKYKNCILAKDDNYISDIFKSGLDEYLNN